ncbi:MAG: 30S ribosomal protein S21 [Candidatus Cloacimonetes bacterium]|jgi:small subunit ribosomal protein S21|nr:30S ribosomal protein S21 [Candidatus Cloacimonadota bacterium]MDD4156631.1 30S ribosomal protein S21 [Candidatus Cloacimonadota bacterium]
MPIVYAKETEPFEITLKRFKKRCEKAAILSDIKKHQAYEKPSEARKRKENAARRKMFKMIRKMERYS